MVYIHHSRDVAAVEIAFATTDGGAIQVGAREVGAVELNVAAGVSNDAGLDRHGLEVGVRQVRAAEADRPVRALEPRAFKVGVG